MTENFIIKGLIEETYKFAYKSLLEDRNYLRLDSIKNPLIKYILVLTKSKDKKRKL